MRHPGPRRRTGPTARTQTISKLIVRLTVEMGREPTDAELASLLATSVVRIQFHRRLIEGRRR